MRSKFSVYRVPWVLALSVASLFSASAVADEHKPVITTFDAPDAGTGAGQGTTPIGIVQGGWVMGKYIDANGVSHGFLRAPDGTITEFDAPGAGTSAGQGTTAVWGMNPALEIAGTYVDANNILHGFLRTRDGKYTTLDAPGAATGPGQGTECESLSPAGVVQGDYSDANGTFHGFLRDRDGKFTTFDAPGGLTGPAQGIYPAIFSGINPEGANVGEYLDANYVSHAYLRAPDGTFKEFDYPGAGTGFLQGTFASGINPAGEINGSYEDTNNVYHGYLRAPDDALTQVDVPGAGSGIFQGTDASQFVPVFGGINPAGTIMGFYVDQNNVFHGYLRDARGHVLTFDVPGAGTGYLQGTLPLNINPAGEITGYYIDASGQNHGFVRIP